MCTDRAWYGRTNIANFVNAEKSWKNLIKRPLRDYHLLLRWKTQIYSISCWHFWVCSYSWMALLVCTVLDAGTIKGQYCMMELFYWHCLMMELLAGTLFECCTIGMALFDDGIMGCTIGRWHYSMMNLWIVHHTLFLLEGPFRWHGTPSRGFN